MSQRRYLHAYLKSQDLHRQVHRLTKAFEDDCTDMEIMERLLKANEGIQEIINLMTKRKAS